MKKYAEGEEPRVESIAGYVTEYEGKPRQFSWWHPGEQRYRYLMLCSSRTKWILTGHGPDRFCYPEIELPIGTVIYSNDNYSPNVVVES